MKGDNREIFDDKDAQKLDEEKINKLKNEGLGGSEIIQKLIENSSQFNKKTQFSKEKYIRKKMEKYMPMFEVRRPTALEVCEAYGTG